MPAAYHWHVTPNELRALALDLEENGEACVDIEEIVVVVMHAGDDTDRPPGITKEDITGRVNELQVPESSSS